MLYRKTRDRRASPTPLPKQLESSTFSGSEQEIKVNSHFLWNLASNLISANWLNLQVEINKSFPLQPYVPTFILILLYTYSPLLQNVYNNCLPKTHVALSSESESHTAVSDSLQPHRLYNPWNSPDQNTGVGSLSLLQGIFPGIPGIPGIKPRSPALQANSLPAEPQGKQPGLDECPNTSKA